jgi:1-acyl-sn-glycerol-3-phosphate acyltransferase
MSPLPTPSDRRLGPATGWDAWPRLAATRRLRWWCWRLVFGALVRLCARPLEVTGLEHVEAAQPTLFVANHASHADTAVLLATLGVRLRGRLVTAAADDYFFSTPARAFGATVLVGALPFPRRGHAGLDRFRHALDHGYGVLLFPQGSRDGGGFRPGAGVLATEGVRVVPVGLSGCGEVLPKGRRRPRRAPVTVRLGAPLTLTGGDPAEATRALQAAVAALTDELRS